MTRLFRRCATAVVFAVAGLATTQHANAQAPSLEVGQLFPIINMPTTDSELPQSLLNYRGKKIVLHVFASW